MYRIEYITYNEFKSFAFAKTDEELNKIVHGFKKLKHISKIEVFKIENHDSTNLIFKGK